MKKRATYIRLTGALIASALVLVLFIFPTRAQASPENAVASVTTGENTEYYSNISAAVSGWADGGTLKLLQNVSGQISTSGGTKTLDLNGHNISRSGAAIVADGTNLTVMNSASTASKISNTSSGSGSAIEIKNGHLYLYDVTVESRYNGISLDASSADIYSGTISVTSQWKTCLNVGGPGKAIIHGGTFRSANHMAIYLAGGGEAEIEGGSFKGGFSAAVVVKGGYFDRDVTSLCAEGCQCIASNDTSKGAYMIKKTHSHDGIVFEEWTSTNSLPTSAGNYYLANDIMIGSTWSAPSGTTNLCLNGYGIRMTGSGSVIKVPSGAVLNLCDSHTNREHKFNVTGAGLAALDETNGNYIVKGGYITGGYTSNGKGGGIYVAGTLNMAGGTVIGNNSNEGGGIYVLAGANANLNGSAIIGNTTVTPGGGGGGLHLNGTANVTLTNCKILYNRAATNGGGISHSGSGALIVDGGEIKYNETRDSVTSIYKGGAIALGGSVQIRGDLVVSDNTHYANGTSTLCNIVDAGAGKIIVAGELGENASIGVSLYRGSGVFTTGLSGNGTAANFTADNSSYEIRMVNGEAYVGPPHTHAWVYSADGNVLTAACSGVAEGCCDIESQTAAITASGKTYDGTPVAASVSYSDGWTTGNGLAVPEIVYSGNTDAGTYTASITLGNKTASASFTIDERSMADEVSGAGYTGSYDGNPHSITVQAPSGATVKYGTQDGSYTLDTNPAYTDAGTYTVYYQVTRKNYVTVTGSATVVISPINATVAITGNTDTFDYDGTEHTVTSYTALADTALYDVTKDFTFSGTAEVKRTDAGTTAIGLAAEQFANENPNFATVTFIVTDGCSITVVPVDAVILTAPQAENPICNDSAQQLISKGVVDGGTLYYALGADPKNAPDEADYDTQIPTATATGGYYVWYKVVSDENHNDLAPVCLKSVVRRETWVTLTGTLYASDGKTPLVDGLVTLVKGNEDVDYTYTDSEGRYQFIVPAGVYNAVVSYGESTETALVTLYADGEQDVTLSAGKTESRLQVDAGSNGAFGVVVDGLRLEAQAIRRIEKIADDKSVSVLMTVEARTEQTARYAAAISTLAYDKSLMFFDTKVEKTVNSVTTAMKNTATVLEIAVPYAKTAKRGVAVYACDGADVETFRQSDTGEDGTFRIDRENGLVYIYSDSFSTFAIGYTPYYRVAGSASLGSFKGNATVVIRSENSALVFKLENVAPDRITFPDIPKGRYVMTVTWEDGGVTNTLTMPLSVS